MSIRLWQVVFTTKRSKTSRKKSGSWARRQSSAQVMAWAQQNLLYNSKLSAWKSRSRKRRELSTCIVQPTQEFPNFGKKQIVPLTLWHKRRLVKLGVNPKHLALRHQVFYYRVGFTSITTTLDETMTHTVMEVDEVV